MSNEDHFSDFDEETTSTPTSPGGGHASQSSSHSGHSGSRTFADEIFSKKILAKMRTFFIDVKESSHGKFIKISEKSRGGQKSTIMMDSEDIDEFILALQEAKGVL